MMAGSDPLLSIRDYSLTIDTFDGSLKVLDEINLSVGRGQTVGIVGETGCGKSITVKSIVGLVPSPPAHVVGGEVIFDGRDLTQADAATVRDIRGQEIAMIFQDPMTYLNPLFTVGRQLKDVIKAKDRLLPRDQRKSKREVHARALELLQQVHLANPERQLESHPHQLSGGMRQRVLIAMALAGSPKLLIADEPTTALDVTIQAQILDLIKSLVDRLGMTVLLISHDLGVVAAVCKRIVVMYAGVVVEDASTAQLFNDPQHPYTRGLLAAIPRIDGSSEALPSIAGSIPNFIDPPRGCRFHPRCPEVMDRCRTVKPIMGDRGEGHWTACHLYGDDLGPVSA